MPSKTKIFIGFVQNGTIKQTTVDAEKFCNEEGYRITHIVGNERYLVITTEKSD